MSNKVTFKQYLESKNQLFEAIQKTPIQTNEYKVTKYCKLPIGESKSEKEIVALKPKQSIIVEWKYDDIDNPTILGVKFSGVSAIDESVEHKALWSGHRLQQWLFRNTIEK